MSFAVDGTDPRPGRPGPTRSVVLVCLAVLVTGVVLSFVGALRSGVSWDEPAHVERLTNYFQDGRYAVDFKSAEASERQDRYTYAPVAMLILHGVEVVVTGGDEVAVTAQAYAARHVGVVLIGLVGTLAVGGICWRLLRSWRWGLVGLAVVTAIPAWTGSLMFNIKDVPVATGLTLVTLALVRSTAPGRRPDWWLDSGLLAAGVVLALGTRQGVWPLMIAQAAVWAVMVGARAGWQRRVSVAGGLTVGLLAVVAIYPYGFTGLWWWKSVMTANSFRPEDNPRWYIPLHAFAETPLLLLGCWAFALWLAVWSAGRMVTRASTPDRGEITRATGVALVVLQALLLPLIAVVAHSEVYNGLRQVLFAIPASAVLATIGLARLLQMWTPARRPWVAGVAVAAMLAPVMTDQIAFTPYQYSWGNPLAEMVGATVVPDYWRVSFRELVRDAPRDGVVYCSPATEDGVTRAPGSRELIQDCRTSTDGPLYPFWPQPVGDGLPASQFYAFTKGNEPVGSNCRELATVSRTWLLRTVVYSRLAVCDRVAVLSQPVG